MAEHVDFVKIQKKKTKAKPVDQVKPVASDKKEMSDKPVAVDKKEISDKKVAVKDLDKIVKEAAEDLALKTVKAVSDSKNIKKGSKSTNSKPNLSDSKINNENQQIPAKSKLETDQESSKKYKRSDSKYSKEKEERTRSNPKYEYSLDDADANEKNIILNGTINDRVNCLALLCARNPSEKNFKQLLMFCERQRNDIIYHTLKLLRDLCKEVKIESAYIKNRIIKSFEMGARNQYIKDKVIEIIGVLIRAEIYPEEFVNLLVTRLIEKGETLVLIESALKSVFVQYKKLIFDGIEDFYFKNDSFRCQYNVLKFLQEIDTSNDQEFFRFFDQALTSLDDYPQEQKDLMIELIVNSLAKSYFEGETVTNLEFLRSYVKSARSSISVLSLLIKMADPFTESYVLRLSRTSLLRNTKYEPEFLNMVYSLENKDMFAKLVDNSFFYSVPSILSLMLIAHEKVIDTRYLFSLHLFMSHYNPLVRDVARRLLNKEKMQKFDPFDKIYVEGQSRMLGNGQSSQSKAASHSKVVGNRK